MKIQIGGLSEGIHEYHLGETAQEIGLGAEFSDVTADVTLDKTSSQIALRARLHTQAHVQCDRCTRPFTLDLAP